MKFFLTIDLYYSFLRFIYFILNQKFAKENREKNNLFRQFNNSLQAENNQDNAFTNIVSILKDSLEILENTNKLINKTLKSLNTQDKNIINNDQIFTQFQSLFLEISKILDFEILVPVRLVGKNIEVISLNGKLLNTKFIDNSISLTEKRINKGIILLSNNNNYFICSILKSSKNISSNDNLLYVENLINSFSLNITYNNNFKVKIQNKNLIQSPIVENEEDVYIKRDHLTDKLNKFILRSSGYLFIVGAYGTGKTTLLNVFEKESDHIIYKTTIEKSNYKKNIKEILKKINIDKDIENSQDLLNILHSVKNDKKQIIIFEDIHLIDKIDNFLSLFPQKLPENIYIFFSMSARENIVLPMLESRELYYIPSFSYNETKTLVNRILNYQSIFHNESIEEIIRKTYGFPLFIKIYLYKNDYFLNKRFNVEKKFLNLVDQLEEYTTRYDIKLKNYAKYFFTLLAISKEGFTKSEVISIFPALSNILIENYIDHSSDYLVKVNSRYKLSSYIFEEMCTNYLCSKDELKFLHNKIIDFYEPWDKKVNSLSLKYLPYHYLETERIDKAKSLMMSSFTKSKFKLYGKETLADLSMLIKRIISENGDLHEIFNFSFIYQRLKDTQKREFIYILDMAEEGNFSEIISKSFNINKSFERFLQLLLISYLAIDSNSISESRRAIKKMMSIPNNTVDSNNSEIVFKICADILSKGVFDIINLPRNRDDGVNIIKNLKETEFSYKVIEIILRLLDSLNNEIDKSVMLEALMNKIIDFENISTLEKFYKNILSIISKVNNENIRDRLYHVYILCILKKPDIYDIFLNNLIDLKNKISTSLFKYLFYSSLSVLFIKLKQEKISYDYISKSISFIEELDNLNHIPFMISNLIFTLKNFEKTYFYDEIIKKTFYLIGDISFSYEGLQSQINLINDILLPEKYKKEIKAVLEQVIKSGFDNRVDSNINNITFTKSYISSLFKIKDKRVFNALYNKIIKSIKDKTEINQINIYLSILDYRADEEIYKSLLELISNGKDTEKKIIQVTENITAKNTFSTQITDNAMILISNLDQKDLSKSLIYIIHNMDKKGIAPSDKFSEHIYNICNNIDSISERLKVLVHLAFFLVNGNQKESGLQLIRKIFSSILSENEEIILDVTLEILENVSIIKDSFRLYYLFSDILVNIYSISHYIKDDSIQIQIIEKVFNTSVKLNFTDLKNIFYRSLEIANKTVNAKSKMQIVDLVRKYLPNIKEKNFIVDIIQKSILISEENFSENDLKLMSIVSLAYINRVYLDIDKGRLLFKRFANEIRFSSYQEYISEALIHISKIAYKIEDKEESISIYKQIIDNSTYITGDYYLFNTYSSVITHLTKISDIGKLYNLYILLIKIGVRIDQPYYKSEYLSRLISAITNFKIDEKSLELINKIFTFSYFIKDEKELSIFFKSFIISINKSLSMYPLVEFGFLQDKMIGYLNSMEKSLENIKSITTKAELYSLLGLAYYKFDKSKDKKDDYFKKSVQLIKDISDNENKVGIETLTALRIIASKNIKYGNRILDNVVNFIINQTEDKDKYNLFEVFASYKNHISKSETYKDYIENMIDSLLVFKSNIYKNKIYIVAFNYYYQNKDIDKTYFYIEKAEKSLLNDDSYDATEQKISLAINLININQFNKGSNILLDVINNIKTKPKRILYELYIKIFSQISLLPMSKYSHKVYESILVEISILNLNEVSDTDLSRLASSYVNIRDIKSFKTTLKYIDNHIQKENLINNFIDNLTVYEDMKGLIDLLPLTLFSVKLTDKVIASIILLINDKDKILLLNENLSI